MNIFFLDGSPKKAAEYQCDKHVIKMILESAQLLSTCHHVYPYSEYNIEHLYKKTHVNHPMAIWARAGFTNYVWLSNHAYELCKEYTIRFGKVHKSEEIIKWCFSHLPDFANWTPISSTFSIMPDFLVTKPPLCMPDEYKCDCVVSAYRNYYQYKSSVINMKWTNRERPTWLRI